MCLCVDVDYQNILCVELVLVKRSLQTLMKNVLTCLKDQTYQIVTFYILKINIYFTLILIQKEYMVSLGKDFLQTR